MNPKIFVGAAVAALAIVVGIIGFSGQSIINDISNKGLIESSKTPTEVLPLEVQLDNISILDVDERTATIELKFKISNPNQKSVILQFVKYQLYENGVRIKTGEIGERIQGMVGGSNYFTILSESSTVISDKATIQNTGNTPELWNALTNNNPKWKIEGEAFFNLSSMTSGAENEVKFEFEK